MTKRTRGSGRVTPKGTKPAEPGPHRSGSGPATPPPHRPADVHSPIQRGGKVMGGRAPNTRSGHRGGG